LIITFIILCGGSIRSAKLAAADDVIKSYKEWLMSLGMKFSYLNAVELKKVARKIFRISLSEIFKAV